MNAFRNRPGGYGRLLFSLLAAWLIIRGGSSGAQSLALNVTNYGARGDAVHILASTVANSTSVTCQSNIFSAADVGKAIELFGVGAITSGTNRQDLVAHISSFINAANITISSNAGATGQGIYCIYGTDNSSAFQQAVNASTNSTNTTINIPAGNYLMIPAMQYSNLDNGQPFPNYLAIYWDFAIHITSGGIHFLGAGRDSTILTACGAFRDQGGYCLRGAIFNCIGPMTNPNRVDPLIWDGVTFDGGLQYGLTGNQGTQPADPNTGIGWDGSSAAGTDIGLEPLNSVKIFQNCRFQHMRGEMIKGITGSAGNETILVTNCDFTDGNATAFNYNFSHTITGCTFSNMYQIEEFYLEYPTNAGSSFVNNYATNVQHSFIALNGGTFSNEPYVIANNVFYQNGGNGIATTPACNVSIVSNQFLCSGYSICIVLGEPGYQGYSDNSNIVIAANNFVNPAMIIELGSGPPNNAEAVRVYGNTMTLSPGITTLALQTYGWATNIHFFSNDFSHITTGDNVTFSSGAGGAQFALVDINNLYATYAQDWAGITNMLDYAGGSEYQTGHTSANTAYVLQDSDGAQIPPGAEIFLDNSQNSLSYPVYLNSAKTRGPVTVPSGQTATFQWTNGVWQSAAIVQPPLAPPTDLHVIASANGP
jgi:hypothetical protein